MQTTDSHTRHVALLQIQGKDFSLEPIPLRTVRPFVIDEVCLLEAAEEEDFDVTDQIVVGKFLRRKVTHHFLSFVLSFLTPCHKGK